LPLASQSPVGLRERKKAKTRAAIQREALRLFREQGYEATTVEQIAEAAEVSPSTFFRYFPTKEDAVVYDALDPLFIAAFRAQPPELRPMAALRAALHAVFAALPAAELARQRERAALIFATPELRAAMLAEFARTEQVFAELVAERAGRPADDFATRVFVGALTGAGVAAWVAGAEDPAADYVALLEAALALLEAGLPL
jgi:AcrR family transcriptional regulator